MNDDAKYHEFEEALTDVLTEKEYILKRRSRLATAQGLVDRPTIDIGKRSSAPSRLVITAAANRM
jgi:hypothetical protein